MKGDNKVQYAGSSGDNSKVAKVRETNFDESIGPKVNLSDDPLLIKNSKENKENVNEKDQSLEYPPEVFAGRDGDSTNRGSKGDASKSTPNAEENDRNVNGNKSLKCNMEEVFAGRDGDNINRGSKGDASESVCSRSFKKSKVPPIQETKMENMELRCVRSCWGNYAFNYIHSNSVGNSRGILCSWDPNSFRKIKYTILDSFVIIWGVWLKNGIDLLIVAMYAPHDPRDKRMLWDYLVHTIDQWDGVVVIMGDFNEVQHKSGRFGLIFNGQGVDEFNSFIANEGLEEVPLGGSAFTWCHKSATKMSKLDWFLISENLFITCPHITATTLKRYLSDHRPILLRETSNDYGPIREWIKSNRHSRTGMKEIYKEEIRTLDDDIDNGNGSDTVVHKRMEMINALQLIDKLNAMEIAQKTNIKWFDKPMEHRAVVDMCYPRSLLIDQQKDLERMVTKEEKIIAKILANRLVRVLGDIVNEVQSAFIAERQILDRPFILNDVLQWCIVKKKQSLIFKVDFEKAYDSVRWDFLDDVLKKYGFGNKWCDWIQTCLKSSRGSILINGQWSDSNINTLIHVLDCFYRASGLRMNMSKIMGVHVEGGMVKHAASKLGCLILNTPFYYLGSKVGGSMSRLQAWKEVIDKVKSRLSKWKIKALSIGGRKSIHGEDRSMGKAKYAGVRTCWTTIVNEIRILIDQGMNVLEFMRLKLENGKSVNVCNKLSDPSMDYSFRRKTRGGAKHEQLDALMDLVSTVTSCQWVTGGFGPWRARGNTRWRLFGRVESSEHLFFRCNLTRHIARKISLWWNVNYEDVNSYDE
uniref:RNA-directed DNA polymerase, eukaryota n=1 Tax=Tanacetum cinerariifolium TaxID=118510 RepID=A0A699IDJ0_TANCI|nr:RNA-directed DNA polymerase, eukaryota [Tanacetum cinerariifolium]